jgi:hypothetical protein
MKCPGGKSATRPGKTGIFDFAAVKVFREKLLSRSQPKCVWIGKIRIKRSADSCLTPRKNLLRLGRLSNNPQEGIGRYLPRNIGRFPP